MKLIKTTSCMALAGAVALAATAWTASTAAAQAKKKEVTISVISGPFGTATFVLSNTLEQISKKTHPWLRIVASETPGYLFNIKKLDAEPALRKTMVIGTGPALLGLATTGSKPFDKKYRGVKLLANMSVVAVWLATLDDKIKSAKDVAGKRVALGKAAQINWGVLPRAVMEQGWGIKASVQYLGPKPAVSALLDRKADVAIIGGYIDLSKSKLALAPPTLELVSTGRKLHHLAFEKTAVEKTIAKGYKIAPFVVPKGAFKELDVAVPTFIDTSSWAADESFPEELAYEITKMIITHVGKFGEAHAIGKLMSPQSLVFGWKPEDIHPGALRAYKEAGIIK
ncbi:MAG: TAXI family TRAP transporter solute-binding subunit [Hyphomicrobiaceae bacterium]